MTWWIKLVRNLRILPRWVIIFIDLFFISFSAFLGYLLRFNFSASELVAYHFEEGILIYTTCGFVAILLTGSYRGIIRYTGLQDGVRIFYMVVLNLVLVIAINLTVLLQQAQQRSALFSGLNQPAVVVSFCSTTVYWLSTSFPSIAITS